MIQTTQIEFNYFYACQEDIKSHLSTFLLFGLAPRDIKLLTVRVIFARRSSTVNFCLNKRLKLAILLSRFAVRTLLRPAYPLRRSFTMAGKHPLDTKKPTKFKRRKVKAVEEGSGEDILLTDVRVLLKKNFVAEMEETEDGEETQENELGFKRFDEIEVDILELSSLGTLSCEEGC